MGYKETLSQMVEKSGLTLREIADRCRAKGVNIDPSYISKLQTGKQAAASEKISRVLADVCGEKPDNLIFEGYLEKAPKIIRDFVEKSISSIKGLTNFVFSFTSPEKAGLIKDNLEKMSPVEFLNEVNEILKSEDDTSGNAPEEDAEDFLSLLSDILKNPTFPMDDDSMQPLIPKGSSVKLGEPKEDYDGDVAFVKLPGNIYIVRRVFFFDNKVILIPENKLYSKEVFDSSEVSIVGPVKSIEIEL